MRRFEEDIVMRASSFGGRAGCVVSALTLLVILGGVPACFGSQTDSAPILESTDSPAVPLPRDSAVIGEFIARVSPKEHSITLLSSKTSGAKGLAPQSIDDLNILQDGAP